MCPVSQDDRLIGAIYDVATAPAFDRWTELLDQIAVACGAKAMMLRQQTVDDGKVRWWHASRLLADDGQLFIDDHAGSPKNRLVQHLHRVSAGKIVTRREVMADEPYQESEAYRRHFSPKRLCLDVAVRIRSPVSGEMIALTLFVDRLSRTIKKQRLGRLQSLAEHLANGLSIGFRVASAEVERHVGFALLDVLAGALIFVDRHGRPWWANAAGHRLLEIGDPLRIRNGTVTCSDSGGVEKLRRALRVMAQGQADQTLWLGHLSADQSVREYHNVVCILSVPTPASLAVRLPPASSGGACIVVFDWEHTDCPSEELLRRGFHFTPTEARVVRGIAAGKRPSEIAAVMGVGVGTVRSHLRQIFLKTATHRQSELVKLASSLLFATSDKPGASPQVPLRPCAKTQ